MPVVENRCDTPVIDGHYIMYWRCPQAFPVEWHEEPDSVADQSTRHGRSRDFNRIGLGRKLEKHGHLEGVHHSDHPAGGSDLLLCESRVGGSYRTSGTCCRWRDVNWIRGDTHREALSGGGVSRIGRILGDGQRHIEGRFSIDRVVVHALFGCCELEQDRWLF